MVRNRGIISRVDQKGRQHYRQAAQTMRSLAYVQAPVGEGVTVRMAQYESVWD
jgi:hypothetical protein